MSPCTGCLTVGAAQKLAVDLIPATQPKSMFMDARAGRVKLWPIELNVECDKTFNAQRVNPQEALLLTLTSSFAILVSATQRDTLRRAPATHLFVLDNLLEQLLGRQQIVDRPGWTAAATAMKQLVLSSHALSDVSSEPYFFDADEFGSGTTGKQLQQQLGNTTDELRPAPPPRPRPFSDVPLPPPERPLKWHTKLVGSHSSMRSRWRGGRRAFQPSSSSCMRPLHVCLADPSSLAHQLLPAAAISRQHHNVTLPPRPPRPC